MPARRGSTDSDHIDLIVAEWARTWPDLETGSMAVIGRLLRIARYLEREIERVLDGFNLRMSEFNILAALRRSSPPHRVAPSELSRALIISSGGVVKRIDRLEIEGLVKRLPHPTDRRGMLVELTAAGRALIDRTMIAHIENERRLLAGVEGSDRERLAAILRELLITLETT